LEGDNGKKQIKNEVLSSLPGIDGAAGLVRLAVESGQEHLFKGWASRSEEFRGNLIRELARIDWEVLKEAVAILKGEREENQRDESRILPKVMRTFTEQAEFRDQEDELGREALIHGKVGWLVPAGGSGSRLVKVLEEIYASLPFRRRYKVADREMRSFDQSCAKGQLPITPVMGKTFYGLFIEQALALGARVGRMPVLLLMLSDETREASLYTITNHPLYRALEQAIVLFDHGMNPVLDESARIIPRDMEGHLVFSGNGNGGMFKAMQETGYRGAENIFSFLKARDIQVVCFSNVDNPAADIILPRMLGSHLRLGVSLTFGVVKKVDPFERVGMIVQLAGQKNLDKIEYNEFPETLAEARNPDDPSRLLYEHGDVNVFLMDLEEMEKVRHLPLKVYRNKMVKTPAGKHSGNKFESFAFHIIRQVPAENVDVKEILREEQFMPTKNSVGRDSPATVIRALCTRNMRWLEAQGARLARQDVESCLEDYKALIKEKIAQAAQGGAFDGELRKLRSMMDKMRASAGQASIDELFSAVCALGNKAQSQGNQKLKLACDHAYSVLVPGEARAFVEFSPAFALEAEDLAEMGVGEGWVLEEDCQVALTGHPTQVTVGSDFTARRNSVFILDIKNEYGGVSLSDDRWLTFELDRAGSAEIGDNVTIEENAEIEIHVHGSGRLVIPDGTVLRGDRFIEVPDREEVILKG